MKLKKWLIPVAVICLLLAGFVGSNYAPASLGEIFDPSGNPFVHRFSDVTDLRAATFVVSANNSEHKFEADYRCDGTADQVQIQAAIDALPVAGGKVFLLEGTYNISDNISLNKANVTLEGCNRMASKISSTAVETGLIISALNVVVTNLQLRGKNDTGDGIRLNTDSYESVIRDCYIWDFKYGIYNNEQHNFNILNNRIKGCVVGIYISSGHDIIIQGNQVEMCTSYAIEMTGSPYSINIIGNIFEDGYIVAKLRGHWMNITGNIFNRGEVADKFQAVYLYYCFKTLFANNVIAEGSGIQGIQASSGHHNQISHNHIETGCTTTNIHLTHEGNDWIVGNYLPSANISIEFNNCEARMVAVNNWCRVPPSILSNVSQVEHVLYEGCSDLFMDVLAASDNHTRLNEDLSAELSIDFTIDAQPDVPRSLTWSLTHDNITEFNLSFRGLVNGIYTYENVTQADGWSGETSHAFTTIDHIYLTSRTGTGVGDTADIGIGSKLGLSKDIYAAGDVYKVKKNNADWASVNYTANGTYSTVDVSVGGAIAGGDDFTIFYYKHLNFIGL